MATKKELDAQVEDKKKESKEFEAKMRQKASTIGNIVGKDAPISQTEVSEIEKASTLLGLKNKPIG